MNRELMKDFLQESFPNPERKGCPNEDVLQSLAEDQITPNDPVLLHVGSCSECYREYLHLRREIEENQLEASTQEQALNSQQRSDILPFPVPPKRGTLRDS